MHADIVWLTYISKIDFGSFIHCFITILISCVIIGMLFRKCKSSCLFIYGVVNERLSVSKELSSAITQIY